MKEQIAAVQRYYDHAPKTEWDRLQKEHPYEKYITTHVMDRYIQPGDSILDIGGGPGQYSVYYAKKGCRVTLVDLSAENVRFAKQKARQYGVKFSAMQGNALDLSAFADASFDAVFLMGPLYHLLEAEDRRRAVEEARRVLKPGGYLFCSFILMYGGVIYGLRETPDAILWPEEQEWFEITAQDAPADFRAFTYAHMDSLPNVSAFFQQFEALEFVTQFAQEGILAPYRKNLAACKPKERQAWYEYACRFCEKPEYLTHGEHLMYVTRRRA